MLREVARIALPAHRGDGGFDHAAVDANRSRLYVAHTANDAVDVIDVAERKYLRSLGPLPGVAGVAIAGPERLLFTTNRGNDTASVFRLPEETPVLRFATGARPNGIAYDPGRNLLAVAGVGDAPTGRPPTVELFDLGAARSRGRLELPGRTRWILYHPPTEEFWVNVADPPRITAVSATGEPRVARAVEIPGRGPHGLERTPDGSRLFCACDGRELVAVDLPGGAARVVGRLVGAPDVLWIDSRRPDLYAAIGEPGVVQRFNTETLEFEETFPTAPGAHTLTLDESRNELHVFLPERHEDLVLRVS